MISIAKNLTNSYSDRQNILNDSYILQKIEHHFNFEDYFGYGRMNDQGNLVITKRQLSNLLNVNESILDKYLIDLLHESKLLVEIEVRSQKSGVRN